MPSKITDTRRRGIDLPKTEGQWGLPACRPARAEFQLKILPARRNQSKYVAGVGSGCAKYFRRLDAVAQANTSRYRSSMSPRRGCRHRSSVSMARRIVSRYMWAAFFWRGRDQWLHPPGVTIVEIHAHSAFQAVDHRSIRCFDRCPLYDRQSCRLRRVVAGQRIDAVRLVENPVVRLKYLVPRPPSVHRSVVPPLMLEALAEIATGRFGLTYGRP